MTSQELQTQTFERLEVLGFRPARSLPLPDLNRPVRPANEIAARLFALAVLVCIGSP